MADELDLEEVVAIAPEELTEEHTAFLKEHTEELTDEQKETFKSVLEVKEEKKEEEVTPEYRTVAQKKEDKKDDEDDDEVDPEDAKRISKVVGKELKPYNDRLEEQSQVVEVDSFITTRPEAKPYRQKMLTYMKAEHYNALPAHVIYKIVAGDDLEKIGAEKERKVREQASATQTAGSSARPTGGDGKDWGRASSEDVAAQKAKIFGYDS